MTKTVNKLKLGRIQKSDKRYKSDKRTLKYSDYKITGIPQYPTPFGPKEGSVPSDWGMMGNDTVGDCVFAGIGHTIMLLTSEGSGKAAKFTTENILKAYSDVTGYDPNDPNSDQGTNMLDAMNYWKNHGIVDANGNMHKIGAFVTLDVSNLDEVLEAAYIFDNVQLGINFPDSAMDQFNNGQPWEVVKGAKNDGGHATPILLGWDGNYLYVATWGKIQKMSKAFYEKYAEEGYLAFSIEFINGDGESPDGFKLAELQYDVAHIKDKPVPTPTPTPSPTPDPTPTPKPLSCTKKMAAIMVICKGKASCKDKLAAVTQIINGVPNQTFLDKIKEFLKI